MNKYLQTARLAAKKAAPVFIKNFGRVKTFKTKQGNYRNLVSKVDVKIESLIRKVIQKHFPNHKIIGEELGHQLGKLNKNDLVWIIDPIDGTTNYIHGISLCCISIALWDKNGPIVGLVYNPITSDLYEAVRREGAYKNNKRLPPNLKKDGTTLKYAYGNIGFGQKINLGARLYSFFVKRALKLRVFASGATEISLLGAGSIDFYISKTINIWDMAAAALIVQEAGMILSDWQGKEINLHTKSIVAASNQKLHQELLGLLKNHKI